MIRADGVTIHTLSARVAGARPDRRYEFRDLKCLRRPWPIHRGFATDVCGHAGGIRLSRRPPRY